MSRYVFEIAALFSPFICYVVTQSLFPYPWKLIWLLLLAWADLLILQALLYYHA